MKLFYKTLAVAVLMASSQAFADVTVHLHRDLAPVVVDGEELGFSIGSKSPLVLNNGFNQLVVRVSKLVEKQGEHEKYNSEPIVVMFDADNAEFTLKPGSLIMRGEHAEAFDSDPKIIVDPSSGSNILIKQSVLPRGAGFSRDYEKELVRFNAKNNINVESVATSINVSKQKEAAVLDNGSIAKSKKLFSKATSAEKEQFIDWALKNRKNSVSSLDSDSRTLEMLEYWFDEANKEEKSAILSWIIENE